jgi:hypothetical protein
MLLADLAPARQFEAIIDYFPAYELKGDTTTFTTLPGDAPFHTDRKELLAAGAKYKLHRVELLSKFGALVTIGMTRGSELPSGTLVEVAEAGIETTLYESLVEPGDTTVFDPTHPHRFQTPGGHLATRYSLTAQIGPQVTT